VTATDNVGNSAPLTVNYNVQYSTSCGHSVLQPLQQVSDTSGLTKAYKSGSTLPIKFQLCDYYGNFIGTAKATLSIQKVSSSTDPGDSVEVLDSGSSNDNGLTFRYDPIAQQYIYNLSTKGYAAGYYRITIDLHDGNPIVTYFEMKK
jgi:hypothetical protein